MFQVDQAGSGSNINAKLLSPGLILYTGGASPPAEFLACDGSAVNRIVYADLFAIIGTTFGSGDGVSTFNIPDIRGRSLMGSGTGPGLTARTAGQSLGEENHVLSVAELATHAHGVTDPQHTHTQTSHGHSITDGGHNHTQNSHTHVIADPGHNHTQNSHTHTISSDGNHAHGVPVNNNAGTPAFSSSTYGLGSVTVISKAAAGGTVSNPTLDGTSTTGSHSHGGGTASQTATNISNTTGITNNSATATNNSAVTGIAVVATSAGNLPASTDISINNNGSDTGHNTIHPVLVALAVIKY